MDNHSCWGATKWTQNGIRLADIVRLRLDEWREWREWSAWGVWGCWMCGKTSYPLGNHKFFWLRRRKSRDNVMTLQRRQLNPCVSLIFDQRGIHAFAHVYFSRSVATQKWAITRGRGGALREKSGKLRCISLGSLGNCRRR